MRAINRSPQAPPRVLARALLPLPLPIVDITPDMRTSDRGDGGADVATVTLPEITHHLAALRAAEHDAARLEGACRSMLALGYVRDNVLPLLLRALSEHAGRSSLTSAIFPCSV